MSERHELTDIYEHNITWNNERLKQYAVWGVPLAAVSVVSFYIYQNQPMMNRDFWPFVLGISAGMTSFAVLIRGWFNFLEVRRFEALKKVALSYPAYVSISVTRSHANVSPWLTNPNEVELKPKLFGQLCGRYCELEKLSTDVLRQKLESGGVWDPHNGWFEKGKTLDEGLMMAIYTRRVDKETAEIEATKATHKWASHEASLATNLQARKSAEKYKEAIAQQLEELVQEPDNFIDWELDELGGNTRMFLRGDKVMRVAFTLPNGLYKITVTDSETGKKTQKLLRINEGEGGFDLTPPIKSGQLFITNESGKSETISLD